MSEGLMFTAAGLTVAALSSVLGIWLQRDEAKPPRWALMLSFLIVLASGVGMAQAWLDHKQGEKMEADMARMLAALDKLANSGAASPELSAILKTEINAQARANPSVVRKVAQRVADDGRDPDAMLGSYLSVAEVQSLARAGKIKTAPPVSGARAAADPTPTEREVKEVKKVAAEQLDLVEKAGKKSEEDVRAMADDSVKATKKAATDAVDDAKEDAKEDAAARAKKEAQKAKKEAVGGLLGK